MEHFRGQMFSHPSTLLLYEPVYRHALWFVRMLLECNIIECLHLYENLEVHIKRLANHSNLGSPLRERKKKKKENRSHSKIIECLILILPLRYFE